MPHSSPQDNPALESPVVCAGCGCLCDDIRLNLQNDKIVAAECACPRGVEFLQSQPHVRVQAVLLGQEVEPDAAISQALHRMQQSKAPAVAGLAFVTVEAAELAVRLAERLRGWLCPWPPDPIRFWGHHAPDLTLSRGEIEQSADLVIYLGCDPDQVQPRHRERHLRRGQGIQRQIIRIAASEHDQPFTPWEGAMELNWQRASRISNLVSVRLHLEQGDLLADHLSPLVHALLQATCVQVLVAPRIASDHAFLQQWQLLAARQRSSRRFGISLLGSSGKARTITESLTWLTGFPGPIHFGSSPPLYLPHLGELDQLLRRKALDLLIWIGSSPHHVGQDTNLLAGIPQIVIHSSRDPQVDVAFEVPCLDPRMDGHIIRGDGIMLRLAGGNPAQRDPMLDVLRNLLDRLGARA